MHHLRSILISIVLISCSSHRSDSSHILRVYKEDGITIVENTGGPKYEGELFEYIPILNLNPGETEETMLFNPGQFIADQEGWFYVYDKGVGDIVVFDPDGEFNNRFGCKGSGPGEFQAPRFLYTEGDMVYVFDYRQKRTTWFRRSGELVDLISDLLSVPTERSGLIPLPNGDRLFLSASIYPSEDGLDSCYDIVRLHASGDTVWSRNSELIRTGYPISYTIGENTLVTVDMYPYSAFPLTVYVRALGVVAFDGNTPQLDFYNLDGQLHHRVKIDIGDLTVTEENRQKAYEWHDRQVAEAADNLRRTIFESLRNGLRFGEKKAPWTDFKFDYRGYLYLRALDTFKLTSIPEKEIDCFVISPDGEYLGKTRYPSGESIEFVNGRLLVNRLDNDTGEFTLTVYEIRPIVEGLKYP